MRFIIRYGLEQTQYREERSAKDAENFISSLRRELGRTARVYELVESKYVDAVSVVAERQS